ncbi:MAG: YkgJ family cysteine cluster protein [Planctomycetota bacterium]|nr:YkgJ family cysteine cluster protein [Planctomycetota bacterium]
MTGENPPSQNTKDRPAEWLPVEESSTWYEDGLRFECQACGKCCHNHGEGYAFVYSSRPERIAIAKKLNLSLKALEEKYCERVTGGWSFKSRGDACIFLNKNNQCSIYSLRPSQCQTFPFWPELLETQDRWERDVASFCLGVDQGPLHEAPEIQNYLDQSNP